MKLLIGSTFPLSLIRREVHITPESIDSLKKCLSNADVFSFWGHNNTLAAVNSILESDLTPKIARAPLALNDNNYPVLYGEVFNSCWVVSPDYVSGFRPAIGVEVIPEQITGWQILKILWKNDI